MPSQTSSFDANAADVPESDAVSSSSKDTLKKDDGKFEFSPSPETSYRVSYEKHPYTIGLSMFDDDSDCDSDDDEEEKGGDGGDKVRGTTIFRCTDLLISTLEKAQAVNFSEITTRTTLHRHGSRHKKTRATKALQKFASLEDNTLVDLGPALSKRLLYEAREASSRNCL